MSRTLWILAVLLSHWRRHPMQLATLLIGLISATALWSGVQALNAQARDSYDRAAATFGGARTAMLVARNGPRNNDGAGAVATAPSRVTSNANARPRPEIPRSSSARDASEDHFAGRIGARQSAVSREQRAVETFGECDVETIGDADGLTKFESP